MAFIPFAHTPWDEIIPGLFQGGHDCNTALPGGTRIEPVIVTDEFDLVVSLYKRWGFGPDDGVEEIRAQIPDGHLTAEQFAKVASVVPRIAVALTDGKKVLVRCQAGYNRSGLVVALVLLAKGYTAAAALDLIREKRSKWALCNEHFVELIHQRAKAMVA